MTIVNELQPFEQSFSIELDNAAQKKSSRITATTDMTGTPDSYLLETFHQYPHGDFRPTFYNPFEIKHRRRTSRTQLKVLEKSFSENSKPSANVRRMLAQTLDMTPRGVQIWFQNRRAKAKIMKKKVCQQSKLELEDDDEDYDEDDLVFVDTINPRQQQSMDSTNYEGECLGDHTELPYYPSPLPIEASFDINPSSVLFSQFFANPLEFNYVYPQPPSWPSTTGHDNVRTVATKAAAIAAASSFHPSNVPSLPTTPYWMKNSSDKRNELRRKSCPTPTRSTMPANNLFVNKQTTPFLSFTSCPWTPSFEDTDVEKSQSFSQQQNLDYCYSNDANITYQQDPLSFQLTPPLTASCSASTVAGSPISLDSLYHEPLSQQNNLICPSNASLALVHSFYEI